MIDSALILFVLLPASISDLRYYKVPNTVILIGLFLSLLLRVLFGGIGEIFPWLIGGFIPFLLCFILYLFGAFGASDVKLFSVVGCFYGWSNGLFVVALSICIGGIFSVIQIMKMKNARQRFLSLVMYMFQVMMTKKITPYCDKQAREEGSVIPFAVCVSLATVLFIITRGGMDWNVIGF